MAIVAVPDGRWSKEMKKSLESDSKFATMFDQIWTGALADIHHNNLPLTLTRSTNTGAMILGIARVRSWSTCNRSGTEEEQAQSMMHMLEHKHSRSKGIGFLQHRALNSALMDNAFPVADGLESARVLPDDCKRGVAKANFFVGCAGGAQRPAVRSHDELIQEWTPDHYINEEMYMWPLWWPLAQLFALGHWSVDVTAIVARNNDQSWTPPVMPPRSLLKTLRKLAVKRGFAIERRLAPSDVTHPVHNQNVKWNSATSSVPRPFHTEHILRALIAGKWLKQQRNSGQAARDNLDFMFPNQPELLAALERRGWKAPKKSLMHNARPRFDIAAMISNRELYRRTGPFFRYIASDASPQQSESIEIFVSVERVVPRAALADKDFTTIRPQDIEHRILPLTTLGQGKTDLPSKVIAQATMCCCCACLSQPLAPDFCNWFNVDAVHVLRGL